MKRKGASEEFFTKEELHFVRGKQNEADQLANNQTDLPTAICMPLEHSEKAVLALLARSEPSRHKFARQRLILHRPYERSDKSQGQQFCLSSLFSGVF
jgi:hypothetical protein